MKRLSTDAEYLNSGKIVLDADGIPFEPAPKAYVDQRVPVGSFAGTGFPEGKIAAPVGSAYTDTAATNGAIRWIKATGAGATGWVVEYGDTGWRDITSIVLPETIEVGSGGYVRIRRLERHVEYAFKNVSIKAAGNIAPVPSGFRVNTPQTVNSYQGGYFHLSVWWIAIFGTSNSLLAGDRDFVIRVNAEQAWPSSLPGLPT